MLIDGSGMGSTEGPVESAHVRQSSKKTLEEAAGRDSSVQAVSRNGDERGR